MTEFTANDGVASNTTSYTRRWLLNGTSIGTGTTIIPTQTGTLVLEVTAHGPGGNTVATSAPVTISSGGTSPTNTVAPVASGNTGVGQTLSVTNGTWTNSPTSFFYQWKKNGSAISGATASTYNIISGDVGATLTCTVTAQNSSGASSATSNGLVAAATVSAPTNNTAPVVSGTGTVGQTLTTTDGTWNNNPASFSYQWKRNGTAISGAVSSAYTLVSADAGTIATCTVTAINSAGSASTTSNGLTVTSSLPSGLFMDFNPATIPAQTNNTAFAGTWTDSVGGVTLAQATAGNQPKYLANALNGLPGLKLEGGQFLLGGNTSALETMLNAGEWTKYYVFKDTVGGGIGAIAGYGGLNFDMVNVGLLGNYAGGAQVPFKPEMAGFATMAKTSTKTYPTGFTGRETIYCNGGCVTSAGQQGAGLDPNSFVVGARNTAGNDTAGLILLRILYFQGEHTHAQVSQVNKYIYNLYGQALPTAGQAKFIIATGDSITEDTQQGRALEDRWFYKTVTAMGLKYGQWSNMGHGQSKLSGMVNAIPRDVAGVATVLGIPVVTVSHEFVNEPGTYQTALDYLAALAAAGIQTQNIVFGTTTSFQGEGQSKTDYCAWLDNAANRAGKIGQYVDIHNDPNIGVNGAFNSNNFLDKLHPNAAGDVVMDNLFRPKVQAAYAA